MTSRTEILEALQFDFLHERNPINTGADARKVVTVQFAGTTQPGDLPTATSFSGWEAFTNAEKAAFRDAFAHIETFLNIDFVEVTGQADPDINLGKVTLPGPTAGLGGPSISFFGQTIATYDGFAVYDNGLDLTAERHQNLILHELGHALGLKHPFDDGHNHAGGEVHALPAAEENNKYSIMSYTENPDNGMLSDAMMLYDVFALQDIWGRADFNTGGDTYTGSRTDTIDVIWDTKGRDTFDASGKTTSVRLDLRQGEFSSFDAKDDVAIAFGTRIEDAIGGTGKDRLIGNMFNNDMRGGDMADVLNGLQGDDKLRGENGADKLFGGSGNDLLAGGNGRDRLDGGDGDDRIFGGIGQDTFVYKPKSGADEIRDFKNDADTLLFMGLGTKADVMTRASDVGGNVVFDFGGGHSVTVLNMDVARITDDVMV
jgi:Ca2+-binding RTX toxin-like protein